MHMEPSLDLSPIQSTESYSQQKHYSFLSHRESSQRQKLMIPGSRHHLTTAVYSNIMVNLGIIHSEICYHCKWMVIEILRSNYRSLYHCSAAVLIRILGFWVLGALIKQGVQRIEVHPSTPSPLPVHERLEKKCGIWGKLHIFRYWTGGSTMIVG